MVDEGFFSIRSSAVPKRKEANGKTGEGACEGAGCWVLGAGCWVARLVEMETETVRVRVAIGKS